MVLAALVAIVALVALLGPAVLAEPAIVVQPAELAVLAELAEPEPLPDEDLNDEPGLEAFGLVYQPIVQTEKSCSLDENSKKSPLLWLSAGRKLSKKQVFSILYIPSWLRNQHAYAGLVLIKHYNNLSYYRISLGAL